MPDHDQPQIYLITPQSFEVESFLSRLEPVLDARPVACVRLALAADEEATLARTAEALREAVSARDIPLVLTGHAGLVEKLGLDGVHLTDGARSLRQTRKALGGKAIIGSFCAASSHDGMTAGEAGADYISFGPVGEAALGPGAERAPRDLFAWWSQMIELPVVAEGALTRDLVEEFSPVTDFFAIGPEIWRADNPARTLVDLTAPIFD